MNVKISNRVSNLGHVRTMLQSATFASLPDSTPLVLNHGVLIFEYVEINTDHKPEARHEHINVRVEP